jgi:hypothetical protein
VQLGNPELAQARKATHRPLRQLMKPLRSDMRLWCFRSLGSLSARGADSARMAAALNARGVQTERGGQWYATTVRNVLAKA